MNPVGRKGRKEGSGEFIIKGQCTTEIQRIVACLLVVHGFSNPRVNNPLKLKYPVIIAKAVEIDQQYVKSVGSTNLDVLRDIMDMLSELVDVDTLAHCTVADNTVISFDETFSEDIETLNPKQCIMVGSNDGHWIVIGRQSDDTLWVYCPSTHANVNSNHISFNTSMLHKGYDPETTVLSDSNLYYRLTFNDPV